MTDSTHSLFRDDRLLEDRAPANVASLSFGAALVAMLIVAALVLAALKLSTFPAPDLPSLIPMDQPALHSGFTA